jgi:hypothetical protein
LCRLRIGPRAQTLACFLGQHAQLHAARLAPDKVVTLADCPGRRRVGARRR